MDRGGSAQAQAHSHKRTDTDTDTHTHTKSRLTVLQRFRLWKLPVQLNLEVGERADERLEHRDADVLHVLHISVRGKKEEDERASVRTVVLDSFERREAVRSLKR